MNVLIQVLADSMQVHQTIYKTGPDGVKYAVSGEVLIDTSRVPGDPQATLQKAQLILPDKTG